MKSIPHPSPISGKQQVARPRYSRVTSPHRPHRHEYAHEMVHDYWFCIVPGCGHTTRDRSIEALPLVPAHQLPHSYRRRSQRAPS
jgi:hypothetical protein